VRDDMYHFLTEFLSAHPEYEPNPFFVVGESYGGHYAPNVAYAVLKGNEDPAAGAAPATASGAVPGSSEGGEKNVITGVVAVLSSCSFSGLAGVYFEKILKDSTMSLAARNVQLAGYSCVIGLVSWYQSGGEPLQFFSGYTPLVWLSICNNAFGGLLVAVTVKYADNILKNFANTLAIVNVTVVSTAFLGGSLGAQSALGIGMVISSIFVYADMCKQDSLTSGLDSACGPCLCLKATCCGHLGGKVRNSPRSSSRTPMAGHVGAGENAV